MRKIKKTIHLQSELKFIVIPMSFTYKNKPPPNRRIPYQLPYVDFYFYNKK